ncbi:hypothetical protein FA13DRAFT_1729566, partial [Coprinellus micaceus]
MKRNNPHIPTATTQPNNERVNPKDEYTWKRTPKNPKIRSKGGGGKVNGTREGTPTQKNNGERRAQTK